MASVSSRAGTNVEDRLIKIQNGISTETKQALQGAGALVVLEFILGALMVTAGVAVPVIAFPLNVAIAILLIAIRINKPSSYEVPKLGVFIAIFILALSFVMISSLTAGVSTSEDVIRRTIRILIVFMLALLIADRRIHFKSLMLGLGIGMLVNALAFYAGIAPDNYGGNLTGWLNDKNVAGMYHGIIPVILFGLFTKNWQRAVIAIFALPLLFETGSRTSMGAFIIGVLWILFAQKANLLVKVILGLFCGWIFEWMQENFADNAVFGDRTGTDWYRELIDTAAWEKTSSAPWNGLGFGQATVILPNGDDMYFHNSYWTLFVEGGWPWTIAILGSTFLAVFVWKQRDQQQTSERNLTAEAATVFLAVCSWRLGEVMLTIPWAFAVGYALSLTAIPKKERLPK
ncbi:O-antigen ligase family protein [Rothia nasimurium]|uniref:O-antigen ligase family protein n=1 Tax=Rothia nasimurium TaxID=85336 RepID=UPI00361BE8E1